MAGKRDWALDSLLVLGHCPCCYLALRSPSLCSQWCLSLVVHLREEGAPRETEVES